MRTAPAACPETACGQRGCQPAMWGRSRSPGNAWESVGGENGVSSKGRRSCCGLCDTPLLVRPWRRIDIKHTPIQLPAAASLSLSWAGPPATLPHIRWMAIVAGGGKDGSDAPTLQQHRQGTNPFPCHCSAQHLYFASAGTTSTLSDAPTPSTGRAPALSHPHPTPNGSPFLLTCSLHQPARHLHSPTPQSQAQADHGPLHCLLSRQPLHPPVICISRHDIDILRRPHHQHRQGAAAGPLSSELLQCWQC